MAFRHSAPLLALLLLLSAVLPLRASAFSAKFGPLNVAWSAAADASSVVTLNISYDGSLGAGKWFAWGTSSPGYGMAGGDVAVCQPGAPVVQYALTSESRRGVVLAAPSPLLASSGCAPGGAMFSITRSAAAGGYAGALPLAGEFRVIWAVGRLGTLGEHQATGVGTLDLRTGAFSSASMLALQAHGVFMFAAWGVLAPLGVLAARYGKRLQPAGAAAKPPSAPPALWFVLHRAVQAVALAASLAGFCIAVAAAWGSAAHFASPHAALGLAVFVLGGLQALNAAARPPPDEPGQPPRCARAAWRAVHMSGGLTLLVCGAVNVFLGLALYGAGTALAVGYGAVIAALVAAAAWREVADASAARRARADAGARTRAVAADLPYYGTSGTGGEAILPRQPPGVVAEWADN